jgi:ribonuclease VapC
MIVDTSVLLAILFDEPDAEGYARARADADTARLSAGSFVEAAIVVEAQTNAGGRDQFDTLIRRAGIVIEPFTEEQAYIARQADTDFGEPLLFKGEDFSKTDITPALRTTRG